MQQAEVRPGQDEWVRLVDLRWNSAGAVDLRFSLQVLNARTARSADRPRPRRRGRRRRRRGQAGRYLARRRRRDHPETLQRGHRRTDPLAGRRRRWIG
ncbi:MAG: hypothetical protein R2856_03810 [Caldilineaceae bacterium]